MLLWCRGARATVQFLVETTASLEGPLADLSREVSSLSALVSPKPPKAKAKAASKKKNVAT
eukprot:4711840-Alexandrium_andersonii.AAC.1